MEIWNGVPYHDFRRVWFATLIVALGSIFQEVWTLIQVARDEDLGGPSNPGTVVLLARIHVLLRTIGTCGYFIRF